MLERLGYSILFSLVSCVFDRDYYMRANISTNSSELVPCVISYIRVKWVYSEYKMLLS